MCPILFYANDYILSIDIKKDNLLVFLPLSSPHYSAPKNFFKKIHSRGKHSKHYTSCVLYILFHSPNSLILDTKAPKRRVFSTLIIYRGKKIAEEVAASVKNFLISIYRTLQAIKHKVAAT